MAQDMDPKNAPSRKARMLLRVRVEFEGGLTGHDITGEGHSADLNVTGCSVEGDHSLSPGMYLTLRIHLSDGALPITVTLARVRWAQDSLFGVEFIQLPHSDQLRLTQMTQEPPGDEALSIPHVPLISPTGACTILVVDDDPAQLHLCAKMLERDGFTVLTAVGSTEAMAVCAKHVGNIHIALVDVMLQPPAFQIKTEKQHSVRVHGHTLALGLTAQRPGLRTIMMSSNPIQLLATNGIDLGDALFLLKPFSRAKMITAIRQQLEL